MIDPELREIVLEYVTPTRKELSGLVEPLIELRVELHRVKPPEQVLPICALLSTAIDAIQLAERSADRLVTAVK